LFVSLHFEDILNAFSLVPSLVDENSKKMLLHLADSEASDGDTGPGTLPAEKNGLPLGPVVDFINMLHLKLTTPA
jgi:hypothetical protein